MSCKNDDGQNSQKSFMKLLQNFVQPKPY